MIMCVLLCSPVSIRIYYQQGGLFLVKFYNSCVLGIHHSCVDNSDSTVDKTPLQRMQNFYNVLHDTW